MSRKKQRGVAMLLAMTVITFMTILAASLTVTQHINERRTTTILDGDQAQQFSLAVERLGMILLTRDKQAGQVDHLGEPWANFAVGVAMIQSEMGEHIDLAGTIEDMQGRFNLNNLVDNKGQVSKEHKELFSRLVNVLGLEQSLVNTIVDWIDADSNVSFPDGAEDDEYLGLELPYRTANQPMRSPTELYLVKGVTPEVYKKLAPFITVLPNVTKINVNTASAEVLACLDSKLKLEDTQDIVKDRTENYPDGYSGLNDFENLQPIKNLKTPAAGAAAAAGNGSQPQGGAHSSVHNTLHNHFDVKSDHFMITSASRFGEGYMQMFSMIVRENNNARVIHRGQGGY